MEPELRTTIQIVEVSGGVEKHVRKFTIYKDSESVMRAMLTIISSMEWETADTRKKAKEVKA